MEKIDNDLDALVERVRKARAEKEVVRYGWRLDYHYPSQSLSAFG